MLEYILHRQIIIKAFGNILCADALCQHKKDTLRIRVLRLLLVVLLGVGAYILDDLLLFRMHLGTAIQPFISLAASLLYLLLGRRASPKQAVFRAVWAHMVMEMAGQCYFIVERFFIQLIPSPVRAWIMLICIALVIAATYCLLRFGLARWLRIEGDYRASGQTVLYLSLVMVIFLTSTNYQVIFLLLGFEPEKQSAMIEAFRLACGCACIAMLALQNLLEKKKNADIELAMIQQMFSRQQEQFQLSKENIDIINRKCHDLKHQIRALKTIRDQSEIDRQVAEMEKAVMIYDSVVHTGNPVLDVVLTEKSLFCEAHQINLTCLIDGSLLSFVDAVDLYAMFGNALDNAIESVMLQTDKQKRVIQVAGFEEQGMIMIRFRNYCDSSLKMVDGIPVTVKKNKHIHGFGLKSIRYTAEKYGGGMSIQLGNNFFSLQILLPSPK